MLYIPKDNTHYHVINTSLLGQVVRRRTCNAKIARSIRVGGIFDFLLTLDKYIVMISRYTSRCSIRFCSLPAAALSIVLLGVEDCVQSKVQRMRYYSSGSFL